MKKGLWGEPELVDFVEKGMTRFQTDKSPPFIFQLSRRKGGGEGEQRGLSYHIYRSTIRSQKKTIKIKIIKK